MEKAKQMLASESWKEVPHSNLFEYISGADYHYELLEYRSRRASPGEGQAKTILLSVPRRAFSSIPLILLHPGSVLPLIYSGTLQVQKVDIILRSSDGVDFYVSQPSIIFLCF